MAKRLLAISILLGLLAISGCWDLREISASVIASAAGIDLAEDNKIAFSAHLIQPTAPGESGSGQSEPVTVSAIDSSVAMAARRLMLSLSLVPEWGHVKTFLLGDRLARQDLSLCIDFMTRNRNIRPDTNLLVCVGNTPEEVLKSKLPPGANLGAGLNDMIPESEILLGFYVPTTLEEFTYRLSTPGIEPAVPQIRLAADPASPSNSKVRPTLYGTAVFKRNKMVGSLNEYESRGYRWLSSGLKQGGFLTVKSPVGTEDILGLEIINFSHQVKPEITGNNIKMNIDIKAKLVFYEQDGTGDLLNPEIVGEIQQAANQEISRQIMACIDKSQSLQSDILGWGITVKNRYPAEWNHIYTEWGSIFPTVQSNVKVETLINRSNLDTRSYRFK